MLKPLFQSEKIIIHCLASPFLLLYLFIFPSLARKSYWVVWGKDLYFYRTLKKKCFYHTIYEFFRKKVIKNIGHIITYSPGDYELTKKWYGSKAKWHKSFMYPSNLYKDITVPKKTEGTIIILVGNSADPSNNHLDAFLLLEKFKHNDIKIIVPLSYGEKKYARQIIKSGKKIFGEKFFPIEELLPLDDYINLLKNIDIAVFPHKRQQAMGNITTLLGMGKKVYIRNDITTWNLLESIDVQAYDFKNFNLLSLDEVVKIKNKNTIKAIFSEENLLKQWEQISADIP